MVFEICSMSKQLLQGFHTTPPLWKNKQFGLQQFQFPDVKIAAIQTPEIPTNLRLGHQMEFVFKALISASATYEVVLHTILAEAGKTRIGELDFILKHRTTQHYLHIELAYKFYIINPEISEPIYRLMGPNRRDMCYTKLDKLKEKQLPLLYHESLSPFWDSYDIDPLEMEQQCCFKAQLFAPFEEKIGIRPLNMDCVSGRWIRFDGFNSKEFGEADYYMPKKIEWVIVPHKNVEWAGHFETLMEVNLQMVKKNTPMLWVKRPTGVLEKLFVVWW